MSSLGGYELIESVARGSTAEVFRARHIELRRQVALKVLLPELSSDPVVVARFRREAQLVAGLEHAGIVRVDGYGEDDGTVWFAMEWVDGAPLDELLDAHGPMTAEQSVGVVREAVIGLAYVHQRGVVHGDVATSNILVSHAGRSMLVDFGLAAPVGTTGACGTPAFVSPEAASGGVLDARSDVYSCGAVLFMLLAGSPPLPAPDVAAVLRRHRDETPPALTGHGPRLAEVLAQAMSLDPNARHTDAAALLTDLEEAAEDRFGAGWLTRASVAGLTVGVGAAATSAALAGGETLGATTVLTTRETLATGTSTPPTAPTHALPKPRPKIPKPLAVAATVVAAVVAVAVVAVVAVAKNGQDATPTSVAAGPASGSATPAPSTGALFAYMTSATSTEYAARLRCPDGRVVTDAKATIGVGGKSTTIPMVYVGSDVWIADLLPVTGGGTPLQSVTVTGTCGGAPPSVQPADLYRMANLEFGGFPAQIDDGTFTGVFTAKPTKDHPGCPFGAPVATFAWAHGGVNSHLGPSITNRTLRTPQQFASAGLTLTPMTPDGAGGFVLTIPKSSLPAEVHRVLNAGLEHVSFGTGTCDFTRTPPAPAPSATASG